MKINNICGCSNSIINTRCTVKNVVPAFCAIKIPYSLQDVFTKNGAEKNIQGISGVKAGKYGTVCKGSILLTNFFRQIDKTKIQFIKNNGISTNNQGVAYSFLKTSADNPVSTSFVQDCSVMYLYNSKSNTHFLYHIHSETSKKELDYLINLFMPEGYNHAAIVPGNKHFYYVHENYLPKVYDAISDNSPKVKIKAYHFFTQSPEIVGHKGKMYEIPNRKIAEQIRSGVDPYYIEDSPQATFKIQDMKIHSELYRLSCCDNYESVNLMKEKIKSKAIDNEIKKIFERILNNRLNNIRKIEQCVTIEELNSVEKSITNSDMQYYFDWEYYGYEKIIDAKRERLKLSVIQK